MSKSIKEIADELGVTKQAIRKEIANLEIANQLKKHGNQFAIDEAQETLIKSAFLKKKTQTKKRKPIANQSQTKRKPNDTMLTLLQNELEVKNKQIERLQSELEQSQKLVDQQQQLTAQMRQEMKLLEHKTEEQTKEQPKNFWQRIFNPGAEE